VKSIEALHTSSGVYAGVLAVAAVVVVVLAASGPGGRRLLPRLGRCAMVGAAAAGALVWFADARRHAQLVKQAAVPVNGHHETVAHLLADGFAGAFLIVTVVSFVIASLAARRHAPAPGRVPARPRAGAGTWPS
jgi:hypothetical protein